MQLAMNDLSHHTSTYNVTLQYQELQLDLRSTPGTFNLYEVSCEFHLVARMWNVQASKELDSWVGAGVADMYMETIADEPFRIRTCRLGWV